MMAPKLHYKPQAILVPVFYTGFCYFDPNWIYISLFIGCLGETRNCSIPSLAFIASSLRVTEENLVFETVQKNYIEGFSSYIGLAGIFVMCSRYPKHYCFLPTH